VSFPYSCLFIFIRVVFDATKVVQNPTPFNGETQEYVVKIKEAIFFKILLSACIYFYNLFYLRN